MVIGVNRLEFCLKWRVFYRFRVRMGEIIGRFLGLPQLFYAPIRIDHEVVSAFLRPRDDSLFVDFLVFVIFSCSRPLAPDRPRSFPAGGQTAKPTKQQKINEKPKENKCSLGIPRESGRHGAWISFEILRPGAITTLIRCNLAVFRPATDLVIQCHWVFSVRCNHAVYRPPVAKLIWSTDICMTTKAPVHIPTTVRKTQGNNHLDSLQIFFFRDLETFYIDLTSSHRSRLWGWCRAQFRRMIGSRRSILALSLVLIPTGRRWESGKDNLFDLKGLEKYQI